MSSSDVAQIGDCGKMSAFVFTLKLYCRNWVYYNEIKIRNHIVVESLDCCLLIFYLLVLLLQCVICLV